MTGIQALSRRWLTHHRPMMKDELPRWEAQPDEGPYKMHSLSGRWPSCQLLQYRTSDSQSTQVRAAQLGQAWTLPFQNRCLLCGFCGCLAILMFTHNAHRDWSPKGDEQDSGSPEILAAHLGFECRTGLERERLGGSTGSHCISVPMGVHCSFMCTCVCVPICCIQHTCMSHTGTCICNIVSTSTYA